MGANEVVRNDLGVVRVGPNEGVDNRAGVFCPLSSSSNSFLLLLLVCRVTH